MVCASLSQWSVQVCAGKGGLCKFKSASCVRGGCTVRKGTTDCAVENEAKIMLISGCVF